jgi:hypothetical protein
MIGAMETVSTSVISSVDERYALKKGYETTLQLLREGLEKAVAEVTTPDTAIEEAIDDVVRKSTEMWMAFGTQRCRLMVVMPMEEDEKSLVAKLKQGKTVELITKPELRRIGTSNGSNFSADTEKAIIEVEKQSLVPQ